MRDTHPTLARWQGSQKAKQETLQELKAAKAAGFKTLKDYHQAQKKAARSDGEGREAVDAPYAEKDYSEEKEKEQTLSANSNKSIVWLEDDGATSEQKKSGLLTSYRKNLPQRGVHKWRKGQHCTALATHT